MIEEDYSKVSKELISLADQKKIPLPQQTERRHRHVADKLTRLDGADFDREFAKQMVANLNAAVTLFENEAKNGRDPVLKGWATQKLPKLREHLRMAHDLLEKAEKR